MGAHGGLATVGPRENDDKYRIDGLADKPAPGVSIYTAHIESGSLRHDVVLWGVDRDRWETDEWVRSIERYEQLGHHGLADVRETFDDDVDGVATTFVALNRVEGETLDHWLEARPGRDAVGSLSLLIPIAAAVDAFHAAGDVPEGFAPIRPADIVIRPDQTAVLARPPSPAARSGSEGYLSDRYLPPERSAGERSDPVAADAFGVGAVAAGILGADDFTPIPEELEPQIARRTATLPDVRNGVLRAVAVDPAERPRRLVEWLADMRGATLTPMTDVGIGAGVGSSARPAAHVGAATVVGAQSTEPSGKQSGGRLLAMLAVPLLLAAAFVLGRATAPDAPDAQVLSTTEVAEGGESGGGKDGALPAVASADGDAAGAETDDPAGDAQPVVADPAGCDPAAFAEEAEAFIATLHRGFDWTDPDGDCFLTPYEMHWIGSDPYTHDADSTGAIPDPESQITVLINMREDGAFSTDYSLTSCDKDVHASIFDDYVESIDQKVTWRDTDGDCLHDAYELNAVGTDHRNADSDGDGVGDAIDLEIGNGGLILSPGAQAAFIVEIHRKNEFDIPNMAPTDPIECDPDNWEQAAIGYIAEVQLNASWVDTDGDCLHDEYEVEVNGTDPANADSDGDGEADGVDLDQTDGMIEPIDGQMVFVKANPPSS